MESKKKSKILLANNYPLLIEGMRSIINPIESLIVVGEARDSFETQELIEKLKPDVIMLSMSLSGISCSKLIKSIVMKEFKTKILLLGKFEEVCNINYEITTHIAGCLLMNEGKVSIIQAIQAVLQGYTWFSQPIQEILSVSGYNCNSSYAEILYLTDQEKRLLKMIGLGWNNKRIATELCLASQTVRNYVSRLYDKLSVSSRPEAVVLSHKIAAIETINNNIDNNGSDKNKQQ